LIVPPLSKKTKKLAAAAAVWNKKEKLSSS
jgi:hypothetical protein